MSESVEVRPFRREDRAQLAELVNAHVGAVLPGVSLSVNAVLSQLERDPGEYVVDPWVVDRVTLVAIARERLVAAAHLVRYDRTPRVSESYRDSGEIKWLVAWPADAQPGGAGDRLASECVAQLARWRVQRMHADGSLPAPAVYGVPDVWPHVHELYERAGFVHGGRVETVLCADLPTLAAPSAPPIDGLAVHRHVAELSTGFTAMAAGQMAGFVEVGADLTTGGALSRLAGWGELDNLHVAPDVRRRGIGTWLLAHAGEWLRLGGARVLLAYAVEGEDDGALAFLLARGFRVLTGIRRDYQRATPLTLD